MHELHTLNFSFTPAAIFVKSAMKYFIKPRMDVGSSNNFISISSLLYFEYYILSLIITIFVVS